MVCRRRCLKINADKSKVVGWDVIGACVGIKYFVCVLDESGAVEPECHRKVARRL